MQMEQASVTVTTLPVYNYIYMYCHYQFFYNHFLEVVTIPNYLHNGKC